MDANAMAPPSKAGRQLVRTILWDDELLVHPRRNVTPRKLQRRIGTHNSAGGNGDTTSRGFTSGSMRLAGSRCERPDRRSRAAAFGSFSNRRFSGLPNGSECHRR